MCFWKLPPSDFCFLPWVTVPTSQLAARASLQVITKELDYTGIHMCVAAATFPGQVHRGAVVYRSAKCDSELGT